MVHGSWLKAHGSWPIKNCREGPEPGGPHGIFSCEPFTVFKILLYYSYLIFGGKSLKRVTIRCQHLGVGGCGFDAASNAKRNSMYLQTRLTDTAQRGDAFAVRAFGQCRSGVSNLLTLLSPRIASRGVFQELSASWCSRVQP